VDHCHNSGLVRQGLCNPCNSMLGMARDNPAYLRRGADYVERHAATHLELTGTLDPQWGVEIEKIIADEKAPQVSPPTALVQIPFPVESVTFWPPAQSVSDPPPPADTVDTARLP
jgi:hypothetical protein